jgi:ABC-type multidrug transport system fused ATPase/permease subunit
MTMGVVYQLTFFLALGLLAIVITVFVFAVSLLGRAMEAAAKSEQEKLAERRENNAKEMATIKAEIEKAEASGQIPTGLTRKLKKLEKRDKKFDKELGKIRRSPKLLTVKGGVVPVGVSLLVAISLSGVAWYFWYLYTIDIFIWIDPVFIWIVGLAAILYSIFRIYQCLRVIESVAITSEQAALLKETEALKKVFRELEEERKPELSLSVVDKKFPLRVRADSESSFTLKLNLVKGDVAEDIEIHVCLPPGFNFLNEKTYTLSSKHVYPNYIGIRWLEGRIIQLDYQRTITFKSPSTTGSYNIVFFKFCRGFAAKPVEKEIIVE